METPISAEVTGHVIPLGNYRLDGEARALYWAPYREQYERIKDELKPGQQLTPESGIAVALMGNSQLNWNAFDLREQDRDPFAGVPYPGKSAHIDFTNSLDPKTDPNQIDLNMVCDAVLNRKQARRTDHLYAATIQQIEDAGFRVFYAPQDNHPLHLRMVHVSQMGENPPRDIKHTEKEALTKAFKKIK